jgi:hypothetical protein
MGHDIRAIKGIITNATMISKVTVAIIWSEVNVVRM